MTTRQSRRASQLLLTGMICTAALAAIARTGAQAQPAPPKSGAELYREACATCHGVDGAGNRPSQLGFEVPLPDFTDCAFASREPNSDWIGVAHKGGPGRAFDEMMPAFGDAFTEPELERILTHVRTFCDDDSYPRGELNMPRGLLTEKAYPEDEAVFELGVGVEGPAEVTGKIIYETRFASRGQFELIVPWAIKERDPSVEGMDDIAEGVGDIALGLKYALLHSFELGSIFAAAGEIKLPTGDEADGLGKGTFAFEPFLAYGQNIPVVGFLQLQGGAEIPFNFDKADPEFFGRGALGHLFRAGPFGRSLTPMMELELKGEIADDEVELAWAAAPQIQIALSQRQHVLWNIGLVVPLNELDARQAKVMTYLLWDWFDGGFFEGW